MIPGSTPSSTVHAPIIALRSFNFMKIHRVISSFSVLCGFATLRETITNMAHTSRQGAKWIEVDRAVPRAIKNAAYLRRRLASTHASPHRVRGRSPIRGGLSLDFAAPLCLIFSVSNATPRRSPPHGQSKNFTPLFQQPQRSPPLPVFLVKTQRRRITLLAKI